MTRRKLAALLVPLAALAVLAVVAAGSASGAAKPIIIGYPTDFTGRMAPFDAPAVAAAQVRIKQINAKGGINGRQVKLITCDTQDSNPQKAKSCAASLISQGAVIGMVTCDVDLATPAVQEFLNKGIFTISPCTGTDQLSPKRFGKKGNIAFSIGNAAQDEGAAMAEYAIKRGWKTATVVTDNFLAYFKDVCQAFTARFTEKGGKIVAQEGFTQFDKTIQNVASKVNNEKADLITFCTSFQFDQPAFHSALRSLGNNTPIINSWGGDGGYWWPKSPKVSNYYFVTYASAFGDDPSPEVRSLIGQIQSAGGDVFTGGFVTGAASIEALKAAITRAGGSTKGTAIAAQFLKFKNYPTVSGPLTYSPGLHADSGRTYRVIKVDGNVARRVALIRASSPAKIG
jgi:branched-chain amino acid transport system substrate-binding protein